MEPPADVEFYLTQGPLTELPEIGEVLDEMPDDVPSIAKVVQGLMLHIYWANRYGEPLTEKRKHEVNIRSVKEKITQLMEKDPAPLIQPRALPDRLVGNCRDFSLLFVSLLRLKGYAARARCGFSTYFERGKFVDHWVGEYWDETTGRWKLVDSQLDDFQQKKLRLDFDPLDVPRDRFIVGGQAWRMCRSKEQDPRKFGILQWHGMEFILGDLQRDLLALNKIELLPWDVWGLLGKSISYLKPEEVGLLDKIALFTITPDTSTAVLSGIYTSNPVFHPPAAWLG